MRKHFQRLRGGLILAVVVTTLVSCATVGTMPVTGPQADHNRKGIEKTALDEYVYTPDPAYKYELVNTQRGEGVTVYTLKMTSQEWLTENEVDRPVWWHWLNIARPDTVSSDTALLFIGGGANRDEDNPRGGERRVLAVAKATNSVVAELGMVPNQPLFFTGEQVDEYKEEGRYEDALIAYGWDKFRTTQDPIWLARLPMTKSAVRAMDTITDFLASADAPADVDKFVVAGGSKRGWTTWTTGAVDDRVVAICPIVIDLLNLGPSFVHHYAAYGFWAPAISDYEDMQIMNWMFSDEAQQMRSINDPYSYLDRYDIPKFLINASGDQFFLPDSSQFYWDDLPDEKYIRYVPNAGHGLDNSDAMESLVAFYASVLYGEKRPEFDWSFQDDGSIRVETATKPAEVLLWHATNPVARDFRFGSKDPEVLYSSMPLEDQGGGVYIGNVPQPAQGYTAYFVELTFPSAGPAPYKFTSGVRVSPDVLPFAAEAEKLNQ